jgi:hypothetical protein
MGGIEQVLFIRAELGMPLNTDRIKCMKEPSTCEVTAVLDFDAAQKCGLSFRRDWGGDYTATVKLKGSVPPNLISTTVKVGKVEETGEIKSAQIVQAVNEELLVQHWASAGYPSTIDFTAPTQQEQEEEEPIAH